MVEAHRRLLCPLCTSLLSHVGLLFEISMLLSGHPCVQGNSWWYISYHLSRNFCKLGFFSKGAQCEQKSSGDCGSGLFHSPLWHWTLCMYLQLWGAMSIRKNVEMDRDVLHLTVLKCRFPGFPQSPDPVGLQCTCICNSTLGSLCVH